MYLDVRNIGEKPLSFRMEVPIGVLTWQYQESVRVEKAHLEGQVLPARDGLLLRGRLQAAAQVPCARCLEPFELPVDSSFLRIFVRAPAARGPAGKSEERQMQEEDVPLTGYDGRRIDMRALALEQIRLEMPLKPVCRRECRGLCPQCGVDRNQTSCDCSDRSGDPRWAALEAFRNQS